MRILRDLCISGKILGSVPFYKQKCFFSNYEGNLTTITALALSSLKSNPSLTLPRHTANKRAPVKQSSPMKVRQGTDWTGLNFLYVEFQPTNVFIFCKSSLSNEYNFEVFLFIYKYLQRVFSLFQ